MGKVNSATKISTQQLSAFFMELGFIIQAGITIPDGLSMLAEDEHDKEFKAILKSMYEDADAGIPFSEAIASVKNHPNVFPKYAVDMIAIGERTGRLEKVFFSISDYYYWREQLSATLRSAVVYPVMLVFMIGIVITILITQVLPIFNTVYNQLGSRMPSLASYLMNFGVTIKENVPIAVAAVVLLCVGIYFAGRGILKRSSLMKNIAVSRFASSLVMALSSGLDIDEAFEMAQKIIADSVLNTNINECKKLLVNGESFSNALIKAKIFPVLYSNMLSSGFKAGSADAVMAEIARRIDQTVNNDIENVVSAVEPTLVIIMSVLIGFILLYVMLPLMNIMTVFGG